jgi:HK97 family phage portal protein
MGRFATAARVLLGQDKRGLSDLPQFESRSRRTARATASPLTPEQALKNSVWWAGLVLKSDLMSTFPVDVVRDVGGLLVPVPSAGPLFVSPFPGVMLHEHLYNRAWSLNSIGNSVGIIHERNAFGLPSQIELVPMGSVTARMNGTKVVKWRIGNTEYEKSQIWHERQFTQAGFDLGLSPLAQAAWSMNLYESTQEFAAEWFGNGLLPRGVLRNTKRDKLDAELRDKAKQSFREDTANGDIFVTGVEWEWTPAQTTAATAGFLDQKTSSEKDVARYIGVPAGMLDVEVSTGNVTYANRLDANLQFLVTKLGPDVVRLQDFWSQNALPKPWKLRLNTDALLRMDPKGKAELLELYSRNQLRTKNELRALDNLGEYSAEQLAELTLFAQMAKPVPTGQPVQKGASPWLVPS